MRGPDLKRLYDEHSQPLYAFLLNLTRDENDTRALTGQFDGRNFADTRGGSCDDDGFALHASLL